MTGPEDSHSTTRPISVAELLAKNGTIGAPPVGGRRRRRRGDTDSVTVAELTGEIPIVRDDEPATGRTPVVRADEPATGRTPVVRDDEPATEPGPPSANGAVDHDTVESDVYGTPDAVEADEADKADKADKAAEPDPEDRGDDYADAVADYTAHVDERDNDTDVDFFSPPRRSSYAPRRFQNAGVGAEQMSPDPVDGPDAATDLADPEIDHVDDDRDEPPSYLRASGGTLFGGQSVADDMARRGARPGLDDDERDDRDDRDDDASASPMSSFAHAAWVVGQCVLAVAFGAGLFVAFDQLWKWNTILALVLGVLVILGLVVGVRVVRKTEDIASTLIAVAVGALVTFGPLALLQAN